MKLFVFLFFFIPVISNAQNQYNLSGTVSDAETGEPLPYAAVFYIKKHLGTSTNNDGEFKFFIPLGSPTDTIRISYVGYEPLFLTIESCQNQKSFLLQTSILDEVVVSSKPSKFDPTEFMDETITRFNQAKNTNTHLAYAHYREQAKKNGETIMFMESIGYAIYMKLPPNSAPFGNYKFICENTRSYANDPIWTEYGKNLNDYSPYYVQPSCNGVLRAYRQLESFGLFTPDKLSKYHFKLDSAYTVNNQRVYAIKFGGGIDKGTIHVLGANYQILFIDYQTKRYWSTPFHSRLTAQVYMKFNYIDAVPYLSSGQAIYSKNGLVHENNLTVILQKDAEVNIDSELYGLINFYDLQPFISYQPEQWKNLRSPGINDMDNLPYEQEFLAASGKWFADKQPESYTADSHERIKTLIEQFK